MNKQTKSAASIMVRQGLLTLLFGGAITWGLFYGCAALIVKQCISQSYFFVFATVAICLGCAASSLILALQRKTGGLLCGLICFAVFGGVPLIAGCISAGTPVFSAAICLRLVLLCVCACAGGLFGVSKAEKQARRRRKA